MRKPQSTICQLLHSLHVGGAEILAARLARQLHGSFRFVFGCLDDFGTLGQELQKEGFTVRVLSRQPGVDFACSRRLAEYLRHEEVDLLHTHQYTPFFYGVQARVLYRRPPILFTEHGRWFPDIRKVRRILVNRLALSKRDRVVSVGESVRQAVIRNEGIPAERVSVIYNGIDLSPFSTNGCYDKRAIRHEMAVGMDDLVLIHVARLDPLKDHSLAITTLEHVVRRRPDARLVLVGEGPELIKIDELVQQRQLGSYVRFLGLRADVARLLAASDIFLLTSLSEGIPLTVIEAMAAGLPVVATRVGGVPEIIEDGMSGLLAPSGDHEGLAARVLRLADNPLLRKQMGELGRERACTVFSESQMHGQYRQLYQEMLGG